MATRTWGVRVGSIIHLSNQDADLTTWDLLLRTGKFQLIDDLFNSSLYHDIVRLEPEGHQCCSKMFWWELEGCYCCTKSVVIAPFWFSTEHHWTVLTPFWLLADNIHLHTLESDSLKKKIVFISHCMLCHQAHCNQLSEFKIYIMWLCTLFSYCYQ